MIVCLYNNMIMMVFWMVVSLHAVEICRSNNPRELPFVQERNVQTSGLLV